MILSMALCCFDVMVGFLSSYYDVFYCMGNPDDKTYSIKENKSNLDSQLYNLSYKYFSQYIIIKYIGIEPIYCPINLYDMPYP